MNLLSPKSECPAAGRCARWALELAVKYWPEETRHWGLALAAEIDEATNPIDALRWSLGGIMFFAHSVLADAWKWLKLPSGGSLPDGGPVDASLLPKRSRLITAVTLAATAALLLLPEGREAIRTVRASWQGFMLTNSDSRLLDELAVRAEKDKDAGTLAFVALSTRDPKRAAELVERAVSLDSWFIWVYGARNHRHSYDPAKKEWLERLQAADPGNAVPILLAADARAEEWLSPFYEEGGAPRDKDYEKLRNDPPWMALMEKALAAPRYDNYFEKHYQLMRNVWGRDRNLPPEIFLIGLWSHAIPDQHLLRLYADTEIREAKRAGAAGDLKQAEKLAGQVELFGTRVKDSGGPTIEKLIGMAVSRSAALALAEIYSSYGKTEEARAATARVEQIEQSVRAYRDGHKRDATTDSLRKDAVLVQGFGILGSIACFSTLVAVLLLELWPRKNAAQKMWWRRTVCFSVDWAPATLLVASGAFLICFLPFRQALAEFRVSNYGLADEQRITDAMWSLIVVPNYMLGVDSAVAFWSMVTITLSMLAVCMVTWGFYRARRSAAKPT